MRKANRDLFRSLGVVVDGCLLRHHGTVILRRPAIKQHWVLAPAKALEALVGKSNGSSDRRGSMPSNLVRQSLFLATPVRSTLLPRPLRVRNFESPLHIVKGFLFGQANRVTLRANLWSNANSSVATDTMVGEISLGLPKLVGKDGTERLAQIRWLILHSENFDEGWCVRPTNRSVSSVLPGSAGVAGCWSRERKPEGEMGSWS